MKKFYKAAFAVIAVFITLVIAANVLLCNTNHNEQRIYKVSISRINRQIKNFENQNKRLPQNLEELKAFSNEKYPEIKGIKVIEKENADADFFEEEIYDYSVTVTDNAYYKILYEVKMSEKSQIIIIVNLIFVFCLIFIIAIMLYLKSQLIKPFIEISEFPYELSKGNLTIPLKENKSKYFGRFIWGLDLLREKLEEQKEKELQLQKEKKLLLLSISHDIKTPLSAMKLYLKAFSRNLYNSEEKKAEIVVRLDEKVDEIEAYISEIVTASREEFMNFEVFPSEIYVEEIIKNISEYYTDKMQLNNISFEIGKCRNCLIWADANRLEEVLQNILENAIKYGDGRKISLDMKRDLEEFEFVIRNTGCTLLKKEIPHIYDSFFRGSNVEKQSGSGLGLYICRELIHKMDGEITASIHEQGEERLMEIKITLRTI